MTWILAILNEGANQDPGRGRKFKIKGFNFVALQNLAARAEAFTHARLAASSCIDLLEVKRGARFRLVALVIYDGRDLAADLLAAKLAKPMKRKRPAWCRA